MKAADDVFHRKQELECRWVKVVDDDGLHGRSDLVPAAGDPALEPLAGQTFVAVEVEIAVHRNRASHRGPCEVDGVAAATTEGEICRGGVNGDRHGGITGVVEAGIGWQAVIKEVGGNSGRVIDAQST